MDWFQLGCMGWDMKRYWVRASYMGLKGRNCQKLLCQTLLWAAVFSCRHWNFIESHAVHWWFAEFQRGSNPAPLGSTTAFMALERQASNIFLKIHPDPLIRLPSTTAISGRLQTKFNNYVIQQWEAQKYWSSSIKLIWKCVQESRNARCIFEKR